MITSQIETSKGKVEFTALGNGRPMLIVVGGHTHCKETIFHKGLDSDELCFITPSRPGYGLTPLTDQNKTPKGTAALFVALLDELSIQKAIVVGISAGGLTALEIAANYPDRVENLILMSALTKKWFDETDKVYKGAKKIFAPEIERFTWFFYRLFFRVFPNLMTKTMFKQLSTFRPVQFTKDEFQELRQMTLIMRSYQGFDNDLDQDIDQEIIKRINCPTLILHSENDNSVDISHAQNARDKIKGSKLVTFNNHWGHLLWLGTGYDPILKELKQQITGQLLVNDTMDNKIETYSTLKGLVRIDQTDHKLKDIATLFLNAMTDWPTQDRHKIVDFVRALKEYFGSPLTIEKIAARRFDGKNAWNLEAGSSVAELIDTSTRFFDESNFDNILKSILDFYEQEFNQTDFIAELQYRTTAQGGRQTPAKSGYRPQVKFDFAEMQTTGQQTFIDRETVFPGDTVDAKIKLLTPDYFWGRLTEGMAFEFREGATIIGTGIIKNIVNDKLEKTGW